LLPPHYVLSKVWDDVNSVENPVNKKREIPNDDHDSVVLSPQNIFRLHTASKDGISGKKGPM
jgi:hypothetical protein